MFKDDEVGAPLRENLFRRVWIAGLISNFGSLIQGVGAAWAMTQMAASPTSSRWCRPPSCCRSC